MSVKKAIPGYIVNGRVAIALDALEEQERVLVNDVIATKEQFIEATKKPGQVRRVSGTSPFYSLRLSSGGLRIIFRKADDTIEIVDLMHQKTLDHYGQQKLTKGAEPKTTRNSKSAKSRKLA